MKDKPQIEIFKYYIKDLYPVCIKTLTTQRLKKTSNPVEKSLAKDLSRHSLLVERENHLAVF